MDALLPALIVAALAEIGDRTQRLAMLLGKRFARPGAVIAGIALAALLSCGIAAALGSVLATEIDHRAIRLMTGVALLLAGGGAALRVKPADPVDGWRLGPFLSSAAAFFLYALFDKTQFVVAAIAGGSLQPVATAVGGAIGITLVHAPAVVLGDRLPRLVPLAALRTAAGIVLAIAGIVIGLSALQII
jgi:putative Ca2+/H+ antiporter (TMEM165/GDT1 family)